MVNGSDLISFPCYNPANVFFFSKSLTQSPFSIWLLQNFASAPLFTQNLVCKFDEDWDWERESKSFLSFLSFFFQTILPFFFLSFCFLRFRILIFTSKDGKNLERNGRVRKFHSWFCLLSFLEIYLLFFKVSFFKYSFKYFWKVW